jgi:hypothetical protein
MVCLVKKDYHTCKEQKNSAISYNSNDQGLFINISQVDGDEQKIHVNFDLG